MSIVFRGYVNAYDGTDGLENQNGYGNDVVDYFFDSEDTLNYYINSVKSTTNASTTFARYAKNTKGYFNVCVNTDGVHSFKAYNLIYTAAADGVEEKVELEEYVQSSFKFGYPTYDIVLGDDCTASNLCWVCDFMFSEGIKHVMGETQLLYLNGYAQKGVERVACLNDGCEFCNDNEIPALFVTKGYSKNTVSSGIHFDFSVNNDAILAYEEYLKLTDENVTLAYGVVVAIADFDEDETNDKLFDEEGTLKTGALEVKFNEKNYANVKIKLTGIASDNFDTALHISGYFILNGDVTYINDAGTSKYAQKVTYNSLPSEE